MMERPEDDHALNGQPDASGQAAPVRPGAECDAGGPRQVFHDGVAYVENGDVPVWRLEMGRRAGSSARATLGAFPSLTPEGLELAFAYAPEHKAEFDPLIHYHSGADVPLKDEGDDEDDAAFEAERDALMTEHAEVFRRLAQ
jgi:uncharacterized protein (DUF433 family)